MIQKQEGDSKHQDVRRRTGGYLPLLSPTRRDTHDSTIVSMTGAIFRWKTWLLMRPLSNYCCGTWSHIETLALTPPAFPLNPTLFQFSDVVFIARDTLTSNSAITSRIASPQSNTIPRRCRGGWRYSFCRGLLGPAPPVALSKEKKNPSNQTAWIINRLEMGYVPSENEKGRVVVVARTCRSRIRSVIYCLPILNLSNMELQPISVSFQDASAREEDLGKS